MKKTEFTPTGMAISTIILGLVICLSFLPACDDNPASEDGGICLSVLGKEIRVEGAYSDGHIVKLDLTYMDITTFESDYDHNGVLHHFKFTNVVETATSVQSFSAVVDGVSYTYPKDKCH